MILMFSYTFSIPMLVYVTLCFYFLLYLNIQLLWALVVAILNKQIYITWRKLTSSSAIAERPRDAQVTSIRKIVKWNF